MTDLVQTSEMTSRSAWLAVGSVIALLAVTGAALPFVFLWAAPDVYESGAAMMVSFLQVGIALGALAGGAILDAQGVITTFLVAAAVSAVAIPVFGSAGCRSVRVVSQT